MATIIDILNIKLNQAEDQFHTYSSNIIEGLSTGNIHPNTNEKLSLISYWLEMLQNGIPNCQVIENRDPNSISIDITQNNFSNLSAVDGCPVYEYIFTRNKFGTLVPLIKFVVPIQNNISSTGLYESSEVNINALSVVLTSYVTCFNPSWCGNYIYTWNGVSAGSSFSLVYDDPQVFYNMDPNIAIDIAHATGDTVTLTFNFNGVGDFYNGAQIETSGRHLNIESPVITGGIQSQNCPSLSEEQLICYNKILDYIAIELGFNYVLHATEPTHYTTVLSGDTNDDILLEDGTTLDIEDTTPTGGTGTYDPNTELGRSKPNNNSPSKRY